MRAKVVGRSAECVGESARACGPGPALPASQTARPRLRCGIGGRKIQLSKNTVSARRHTTGTPRCCRRGRSSWSRKIRSRSNGLREIGVLDDPTPTICAIVRRSTSGVPGSGRDELVGPLRRLGEELLSRMLSPLFVFRGLPFSPRTVPKSRSGAGAAAGWFARTICGP